MKTFIALSLAVINLVFLIISKLGDKNIERKKLKEEAIKSVKEGIKKKDPSKITAGFDKWNRMKRRKSK